MPTKTTTKPAPARPTTDMDHRDLAAFAAKMADPDLGRLADAYTAAALDLADMASRHEAARRKLASIDDALGEATGSDVEALLSQRAIVAGDVVAVGIALSGSQRRNRTARLAWLERLRDLATAEAQAAFAAVDAANEASREDRRLLIQADGDYRIRQAGGAGELAKVRARVDAATAATPANRERAERAKLIANVAALFINRITEADRRQAA